MVLPNGYYYVQVVAVVVSIVHTNHQNHNYQDLGLSVESEVTGHGTIDFNSPKGDSL